MQPVSTEYKKQINKVVRNRSFIKITFGITDTDAPALSNISDSGHTFFSNVGNIDLGTSTSALYATLEKDRWKLDGKALIADKRNLFFQGYVGNSLSDENCLWKIKPKVVIDFEDFVQFAGLSFRFDLSMGEYPTEFRIKAFNGEEEVFNELFYPSKSYFVCESQIPICNKIQLVWEKSLKPHRYARLITMIYGIVSNLTEDELVSCSYDREIDLLSTAFPKNDFEFTVFDPENKYNPENPHGLWEYLETRQPISFDIGYELDDGSIEWQQWGNTYSTGDVTVKGTGTALNIAIKSSGLINHLTMEYDEGKYYAGGRSLFDLAEDVMTFAGYPQMIELDGSLRNIISYAPLPSGAVNELLQMIANAGRCVLDVTRGGLISIKPYGESLKDFKFGYDKLLTVPETTKIPPLRSMTSKYYNVKVSNELVELVGNTVISGANSTEYVFNHSLGTGHTIICSGGLEVVGIPEYYAGKTVVTLTGSGSILVRGYHIETSEISVSKKYGEVGEDLGSVQNSLITDRDNLDLYMDWIAEITMRRNSYTADHRGYPEIDLGDNVTLTTTFLNDIEATVVSQKIEYEGSIKGTSKYLMK